ncbi:MAG: hypothetical protein WBZ37_25510 [Mycobacterium sp.]
MTGVPQTSLTISNTFPVSITLPLVLCVWSEAGNDMNPRIYVQARDPNGVTRGNAELTWLWDDVEGRPFKWHVWALRLPFTVDQPGVFTFGIYGRPDDVETDHWFPLPIKTSEQGRHRRD